MFELFYGFDRTPFSRDIPTDRLYFSDQLEETLGRLTYAAERQMFALVTGECGTGKTTTIRRFKETLDEQGFKVLYISDSKLTPRHFYKGLLEQLGVQAKFYRGDAKRQLHREVELLRGLHHLKPVVIVDEGHLLDHEMLEEIRFLLNFKLDSESPMALILVGQSELWDLLKRQIYTAVRQRLDIRCSLYHYDRAQTGDYIRRHLDYAGTSQEIFSDAAVSEIFRYSAGAARLINKLCTHCLIHGSQHNKKIIDDHIVRQVIEEELP
jgi:type II secretory pathway predicted ATPase ExeA